MTQLMLSRKTSARVLFKEVLNATPDRQRKPLWAFFVVLAIIFTVWVALVLWAAGVG